MPGDADPPGARLLDVVKIIDTLVSPGGDPWKREQTHASLARYLLEEAYEAYDAIEADDLDALREELGDVLLQVILHARMAQEADPPWSIDDVAAGLAEKMVRRNPHVFAGVEVADVEEITANWERIKREEKAGRSVLDGVALSQPALSLAAKILSRARKAGIDVPVGPSAGDGGATVPSAGDGGATVPSAGDGGFATEEELGELLFAIVADASARGLDPEAALRRVALQRARAVRSAEKASADPIS